MTSKAFRAGKRAPDTVFEVSDASKVAGLNGDYDGQQISLAGWHPNSTAGGGILVWDSTKPKSEHNGGTVFSPTVPAPTASIADYLNGVGETDPAGAGCFVRQYDVLLSTFFGADGYNLNDDYDSLQAFLIHTFLNNESGSFGNGTFISSKTLILPYSDYFNAELQIEIDGKGAIIDSGVDDSLVTSATHTGFVSGYLDESGNLVPITSGSEVNVAGDIILRNIHLARFGLGLRLHNWIFGCSIENIYTNRCFNGVELTRCFYLHQENLHLRGRGKTQTGSIGYSCLGFSNVMPAVGIKALSFATGWELGGFDAGGIRDSSAETCALGVNFLQECTVALIDTAYLEGNDINVNFGATLRSIAIENSWLYSDDGTTNFTESIGGGGYVNLTLSNNRIWGGAKNTPILNVFGEVLSVGSENGDPLGYSDFSGLPNMIVHNASYEFSTAATGFKTSPRSIDNRNPSEIIPTSWGGRFRNGRDSDNRSPYMTVFDNAGSLEFTTEYNFDRNSCFIFSVNVAHNTGIYKKNIFIMYDNNADVFEGVSISSAGFVSESVTIDNNGGYVRIAIPTFTNPALDYAVCRIM